MSDTENDIVCQVCEQKLGKTRCHYGGITCYSCRAFFRRNTQRLELPVCKADGGCPITATVRKQCAACRYQKCISIGMKPELVLDDDEKKTRFRKFLSKKALETGSNIGGGGGGGGGRGQGRRRRGGGVGRNQSRPSEGESYIGQCPIEVKTEISVDNSCLYQFPDSRRTSEYYDEPPVSEVEPGSQHYDNYIENFIKKETEDPDCYQPRPTSHLKEESLVQINPEDIREIFSAGAGAGVGNTVTSVIKQKLAQWDRQKLPAAPALTQPARKSVIVRAGTAGTLHRQTEPEPEEPNINDVISSALSLFPDDNYMLKTLEDEQSNDPLLDIVNSWNLKWNEVSYDEQVISEYASFCQFRNNFPLNFYNNNVIRHIFRERCLKFLNSLEDYERLRSEERMLLLRKNLDKAEMLVYIHVFNQPTWQEELEFLFGTEDKQTWKFYNTEVTGVPLSTMITCMPISELNKLDIYRTFASCKPQDGLLSDRVVFILAWILVNIEDEDLQPSDHLVEFRNKVHCLLRSYLQQHRGTDVQSDLAVIYNCFKALPRIAEVFATMRESASP